MMSSYRTGPNEVLRNNFKSLKQSYIKHFTEMYRVGIKVSLNKQNILAYVSSYSLALAIC